MKAIKLEMLKVKVSCASTLENNFVSFCYLEDDIHLIIMPPLHKFSMYFLMKIKINIWDSL